MNLPCHVIEDLLPLYHDRVCSAESCQLIEAHLKDCERCSERLSYLADRPSGVSAVDDAAPLKALGAAWKKSRLKARLRGALIALLACAVLCGGYLGLTKWRCIPVSAELLEVSEVSRLADGRIIYHLSVKDDKNLHVVKYALHSDGSYSMTPMRAVLEGKRSMDTGLFNDYYLLDLAQINADQRAGGDGIAVTACYVGPKDQGILIWEAGMELPAAGAALEQLAG